MSFSIQSITLTVLLLLAVASISFAATYSQDEAQYSVDFAGAAYCAGTLGGGAKDWSCRACKKHPSVTNVTIVTDHSLTETFNGYVAYDSDTDRIILSIAGTDPLKIKEWIDDLNFVKTAYPLCSTYGEEPCEVHEGFLAAYELAKVEVRETIASYMSVHPTASVTVTGHSLGAALALLAALDLTLTQGVEITNMYTFGQPRVGDDVFAKFAMATIEEYRVTHHHDPVPHLPTQNMFHSDWAHPSTEVYYGRDSTGDHTICDGSGEDPNCSDQFLLDVNILDHLDYVGFSITENYLDCKL